MIDNGQDSTYTVVTVEGYNRPGLLSSLSAAFRDLGLDVGKVSVASHFCVALQRPHDAHAQPFSDHATGPCRLK